ncbi:hypothetical protein [Spirillospora sp. CA-294931]|uniref:hypothetical protein n=1 Tax=Spirillospora sp. CA-294931 TaxID=3240042 RepID=UPI003D8DC400
MPHRISPEALITSRLQGRASRLADAALEGDARAAAVQTLREIATQQPPRRRGSPHTPPAVLRRDLLAEVAGIYLGAAPASHPEHHRRAAELLIEAGADVTLLDQWIAEGQRRAANTGPPFSRPPDRRTR